MYHEIQFKPNILHLYHSSFHTLFFKLLELGTSYDQIGIRFRDGRGRVPKVPNFDLVEPEVNQKPSSSQDARGRGDGRDLLFPDHYALVVVLHVTLTLTFGAGLGHLDGLLQVKDEGPAQEVPGQRPVSRGRDFRNSAVQRKGILALNDVCREVPQANLEDIKL